MLPAGAALTPSLPGPSPLRLVVVVPTCTAHIANQLILVQVSIDPVSSVEIKRLIYAD